MSSAYIDGIKHLREERGLTQMDVAIGCGVSLVTVQKWDKSLKSVRLVNLVKLARLFEISCDELCGLVDPTPPKKKK